MSAESDVNRYRRDIQDLQKKVAAESSKVAKARSEAAKDRERAGRASGSSASSYLRSASRKEKDANTAEGRRSSFETKLAEKQKALHKAEAKFAKEQSDAQQRQIKKLEELALRRQEDFRPSRVLASSLPSPSLADSPLTRPSHDVFISHASEDKAEVARPLAEMLTDRGLVVWYDEFSLTVGDSLHRSIDQGLASSRFGAVVLSPDFFKKDWPQAELDGLVAKQRSSGDKVILPIWHRLTKDDVLRYSLTLAGLLALNTSISTMEEIAEEIAKVAKAS